MIAWASLPLRIALGFIFMAHGLQKGIGAFGGPGIKGFSGMLASLGFSPVLFWAYVVILTEFFGGLFLILGLFTRISSAFIFILIIVATLKVHLTKGFFVSSGGYEYNLLILCACIALMILGGGKGSITKNF